MTIVVDASSIVALLSGHSSRDEIADILRGATTVLAPAHLDAEVLSGLRGQWLSSHVDTANLLAAAHRLAALPVERARLDDVTLLTEAVQWVHNLSAYDALYLALAASTGSGLLTGDAALARAAAQAGVPCRHVDCSA